jgi:hypothetical protein
MGTSTSWKPQGLSRPVMGLLYLFYTFKYYTKVNLVRSGENTKSLKVV